jgi:hypothetical protein
MSIKILNHVWEHSAQKGSYLVTMLAIADYAHDDGTRAYPSIATLARKTRMSERNVQLVLRKLEADGELTIHANAGPHGCNVYSIPLARPATTPPRERGEKFSGGSKPKEEGGNPPPKVAPNPLLDPSDPKTDPGISSCSSTKKTEEARDGTPSWTHGPVTLPEVTRPDDWLASLGLSPGEEATLMAQAEAELVAEGQNPFYLILPMKHARMVEMLLRGGVSASRTSTAFLKGL